MKNQKPWSETEIVGFVRRQARLMKAGMSEPDSEKLAEQLVYRDRDMSDDRKLCLECKNWSGQCKKQIDALPTILMRCNEFLGVKA